MGKFISKVKQTVRIEDHLQTKMVSNQQSSGECKCRILEMHLKLRGQQFKTIFDVYRLLYQNLMVLIAANQKSTIDVYTKKKDQSKHNTKDSYRITIEENKRGRDLQKQILKN